MKDISSATTWTFLTKCPGADIRMFSSSLSHKDVQYPFVLMVLYIHTFVILYGTNYIQVKMQNQISCNIFYISFVTSLFYLHICFGLEC